MRSHIDAAKQKIAETYLKAEPVVQKIAADAMETAKVIAKSPTTQDLIARTKQTPEALAGLTTLAIATGYTVLSRVVTWAACTDQAGSCETSTTRTFITTAVIAGGAAYYGLKKGIFGTKAATEQPLQSTETVELTAL